MIFGGILFSELLPTCQLNDKKVAFSIQK